MAESSTGELSTGRTAPSERRQDREKRQRVVDWALALPWNEQPLLLAKILGGWEADGGLTAEQLEGMVRRSYADFEEKRR